MRILEITLIGVCIAVSICSAVAVEQTRAMVREVIQTQAQMAVEQDNKIADLESKIIANESLVENEEKVAEIEAQTLTDTYQLMTEHYLGEYRITHYCPCAKCNGVWAGVTASGAEPKAGRTIAVEGFPFGTKLNIDGHIYTVEDRFGKPNGKHIDIFCDTHEEAERLGTYMTDVYEVRFEDEV